MPKILTPIRPRRKDERIYHARVRESVVIPLQQAVQDRIDAASDVSSSWSRAIRKAFEDVRASQVAPEIAGNYLDGLVAYHNARSFQTLTKAFEIDVRPFMSDPPVRRVLVQALADNIALITDIPDLLERQIFEQFEKILRERGFDQQALIQMLTQRFGIADRRSKLITRDQTSKFIGSLSEARNRQLGIEQYVWSTADDERVRPEHSDLDGTLQRWDSPPPPGHPGQDIQCRCVARPYIP